MPHQQKQLDQKSIQPSCQNRGLNMRSDSELKDLQSEASSAMVKMKENANLKVKFFD